MLDPTLLLFDFSGLFEGADYRDGGGGMQGQFSRPRPALAQAMTPTGADQVSIIRYKRPKYNLLQMEERVSIQ